MPFYQFDTSAIVKRYVPEVGSDWVRAVATPAVVGLAVDLIQRHPLRAYDAIQLATAMRVAESLVARGLLQAILVSADDRLLAAAQAEGLPTANPNEHP